VDDLDRKLNAAFREAIRVAPDKAKLRSQQRKWLVEVRDQTSVMSYVRAAHIARILELQEISARAIGRREVPMEEAEQKEICEGIARSASRGELEDLLLEAREMPTAALTVTEKATARDFISGSHGSNFFTLPVRRGHELPFANVFIGGTCYSAEIRRAAPPLEDSAQSWPDEEIDPDEQDHVLRWAKWGSGESVLMFGGRYFFVMGGSSGPGIVTWVTPIGTRRPICSLEVERVERSVSFAREDALLCAAAARDDFPLPTWKTKRKPYEESKWTEEERKLLLERGLRGAGMPRVDLTTVDINNDGVPETLGRGQYDSGAGCGASLSRLMLLTDDGEHLKTGPTNNVLMDLNTYDGKLIEVFSHRSRTYVRATLEGKPALFQMAPDALHTECVFHDQPITRVRTLYPLDGVVRDPDRKPR
jgi:hypothetical protein